MLYYNVGMDIKYPSEPSGDGLLPSEAAVRAKREELKALGLLPDQQEKPVDEQKKKLADKYGNI